jgi:hypothetical protein
VKPTLSPAATSRGGCWPESAIQSTPDLDIYRTANVLIREHGEEATLEAAQRADAMLEKGCLDGQPVRKRVLAAVEEIQREEPREGEAVN